MGDMADFANERHGQEMDDLLDYQSGGMSLQDAIDCGILDEQGRLNESAPKLWGVHDCESLEAILNQDELAIQKNTRSLAASARMWSSGGKLYLPRNMTTLHLRNAIRYARRNEMDDPIVDSMESELSSRVHHRTGSGVPEGE